MLVDVQWSCFKNTISQVALAYLFHCLNDKGGQADRSIGFGVRIVTLTWFRDVHLYFLHILLERI